MQLVMHSWRGLPCPPPRDLPNPGNKPRSLALRADFLPSEPPRKPSVQFSSVAQSCPTLCDPMNPSMPGLPVHHRLPELTQTHVHRVRDAIQPSHPGSSLSPPAPISPSIRVFSNESTLRMRWPKYWSFSFSIIPSKEIPVLQNGLVGSPCSPRDSQESSPTPQFKYINSLVLSLFHSPTLTSIHDY